MTQEEPALLLKKKLLERLDSLEESYSKDSPTIERTSRPYYPLSSTQKRLYHLHLLNENSVAYNLSISIKVKGKINPNLLEKTLKKLIERHSILRTSFKNIDGEVVQVIQQATEFKLKLIDNPHADAHVLFKDFVKPFNLEVLPLLRASLIKLQSDKWLFFIDVPHLIADGLSMSIFLKELIALYQGEVLEPLPIEYKDYAVWQQNQLATNAFSKEKAYWTSRFNGDIPSLNLPVRKNKKLTANQNGQIFSFNINPQTTKQIKLAAATQHTTAYVYLMAIYQLLLSKICRNQDIIVGSSVEGRIAPELRGVAGAFINTIPIRGFPSYEKKFSQFLSEIKQACLKGVSNQAYPFDELITSLQSSHKGQPQELIKTFFDLHQNRLLQLNFHSIEFEILPVQSEDSKFDLSLEAIDCETSFECHFEYRTDLFSKKDIQRFSSYFCEIISETLKSPDKIIASINPIPRSELAHQLKNFNPPFIYEKSFSFLDYFKTQVSKQPHATAVSFSNKQMSYEQLDQKSSHLARQLIALGIREDQCVAFFMERSIEFLIAMIAVFKARASYVPLDPKAPEARNLTLIKESKAIFTLVSQQEIWHLTPSHDVGALLRSSASLIPLEVCLNPRNLAYILFTSGSTGKPKGVMVEHGGMLNHLSAKAKDFKLTKKDVIAQTSSQTFDVSIWQFLVGLVVGARVCIFSDEDAWDTHSLLNGLESNHITLFETVPSHITLIIEELENKSSIPLLEDLRYLILNGEPFSTSLALSWQNLYPKKPIVNAYGPTECSDDVTHFFVPNNLNNFSSSIPIGKILTNLQGFILDDFSSIVPLGSQGELCIGGIGLARGYINRPDITASAFTPCPFTEIIPKGSRIYNTGDLAKYCEDGTLEYQGRIDQQIKINGQRIELGEIESVINLHPKVTQAVVVAKSSGHTQKLLSYLLFKEDCQLSEIQQYLKERLPNYMVPSPGNIIPITSFPLLPSGKIDRKNLPDPKPETFKELPLFQEPQNSTEAKLKQIWSTTLKIKEISTLDHFFDLGGHSLLATQIVAKILQEFGVKIPVQTIYQYPTIVQLANSVEIALNQGKTAQYPPLPTIIPQEISSEEPFPMTDVQQAYWLGRKGIYFLGNVSVHVYAEYDCNRLDLKRLEWAWNIIIKRHGALRTIFTEDGKQKIISNVPNYKIQFIDLSKESPKKTKERLYRYRNEYSHEVFPADQWPLFAIRAVKLKNQIRLYLSFDALIIDGWSVDIIFSEWINLYKNPKLIFPTLKLSFRDYVLFIDNLKKHPIYKKDRQYWLSRTENFPGPPSLPLRIKPEQVTNQKFSRCLKRIPKRDWKKAQNILQLKKISPTGFLAFLFSEILYLYSNSNHFAINLTLFNRPPIHEQINDIAGDFTSLTLLEIKRDDSLSLIQRAQKVQKQLWLDLDHQLFGGLEFIRELAKKQSFKEKTPDFPVVLTSVLGLDDQQNVDLVENFGKEVFSITQTPQVWLDYKAYEVGGDLIIEWDYVTELFEEGFITAMHSSYCKLFEKLCQDMKSWTQPCLQLLEETQIKARETYNSTSCSQEIKTLNAGIKSRVINYGNKIAVIDASTEITYEHLNRISNWIGYRLRLLGVKPNQLIAIIMEKGIDQIAGVLGIHASGAAYLPIDASFPSHRVEELLKIGEVSFVLTHSSLINKLLKIEYLSAFAKDHIIAIDAYKGEDLPPMKTHHTSSDLAYVIFTSGSTGTPKGVMIEHGSAYNTVASVNSLFHICDTDRILALSNLNFDLSVYDIFGLLNAGGAVILPSPDRQKDPSHWIELILKHKVTIWNTVPMFMQILIEYLEGAENGKKSDLAKSLRLVLMSGDWIPTDLPPKIHQFFPEAKIISLGGATEASIWSILFEINPNQTYHKSIPYGFPMRNQSFHILNSDRSTIPDYVPGKLYIGGEGLAQGYWKDKRKTDKAFINHPQYGRLYDTGDIGLFNPKFGIEFLGRLDSQVKIQGHRIELGEIESVINSHPDVANTKVILQNPKKQKAFLAAFTIPYLDPVDDKSTVILDPSERMQFKLELAKSEASQENTSSIPLKRNLSDTEKLQKHSERKSYRTFENRNLTKKSLESLLDSVYTLSSTVITSPNQTKLSFSQLSTVLESLSSVNLSGYVFPKYRYPSAGSLYPVKVFCIVWDTIESIPAGIYSYHSQNHTLKKIHLFPAPISGKTGVSLCLVGDLNIVRPLYGDLSELFCKLEAGYIQGLLKLECLQNGLSIQLASKIPMACEGLFIDKGNLLPLCTLNLNSLEHSSEEPPPIDFYFYIKTQTVTDLEKGWYVYQHASQSINKIQSDQGFDLSPTTDINYSIYNDCAVMGFFLGNQKELCDNELYSAGELSQYLMQEGITCKIGSCPIGTLDLRGFSLLGKVFPEKPFIQALALGPVSSTQVKEHKESKIREGVFEEKIKQYIQSRLPSYMNPKTIKPIDSFPLSRNGKIDTKALASLVDIEIPSEKKIVMPRNNIERKLWDIWKELLEVEELSIDENFFELGGNSLLMTRMSLQVRKAFEVDIPLQTFFQSTNIETLAKAITKKNQYQQKLSKTQDFVEDTVLDESFIYKNRQPCTGSSILLTGATGFLGSHLLKDLLLRTKKTIFCLVRAKDQKEALTRIFETSKRFHLNHELISSRIVPIVGDLSKKQLGCSNYDWNRLSEEVSEILHNGAIVHHIFDYEKLRNANVQSTLELLKLSAKNKKSFVYVSSLLSIIDRSPNGKLIEDFPTGSVEGLYSGYQKTKWVNEMLLKQAHERGLEAVIFRPNTIAGHDKTGVCAYENDHFLRLIKGCIQMNCAPIWDEVIDLLPVNLVSQIIVEVLKSNPSSAVYNLTSAKHYTWIELIHWLKNRGYHINLTSADDWRTKYLPKIDSENALFPLLSIYLGSEPEYSQKNNEKMIANNAQTTASLNKLSIKAPEITDQLLDTLFNYLESEKFLQRGP